MKMGNKQAVFYLVLGLAGIGYGLGTALLELGGLYADTMAAPLEDRAGGDGKDVSRRMLWAVGTGGIGVVVFLTGMVMMARKRGRP
ncbi:MAG: hypothetical protein KF787_01145 [Phycisphaeraceae bacterium]|nr:hypothetical protein [Phycisphaerae bacterium]MBX3391229.1 hypothetical protein [Phycisphaeraceae bacterium]